MSKTQMTGALRAFVAQRSGIDFRNYQSGDYQQSRAAFLGDYRPILKHGKDARAMLDFIENREEITAERLQDAACHRLTFVEERGTVGVSHVTGQYFPTEYRAAACAVLSKAIRDYWREDAAPDEIRKRARRRFGRGIASRWFN